MGYNYGPAMSLDFNYSGDPMRRRNVISSALFVILATSLAFSSATASGWQNSAKAADDGGKKIRVLIVDGQNNHGIWPKTTEMMRGYLLETGLFTVDLARTAPKGIDENFAPDFSKFDVVVSNYNGEPWKKSTEEAFEKFVADGRGFVVVHAADNAFPEWVEYNKMIGLGGWGNRTAKNGPYIYYDDNSKLTRDTAEGNGGSHGSQHEFVVQSRKPDHPVMQGLPEKWLHTKDELYDRLRGPGENLEVLASSFAAKDQGGTGRHEPVVMAITYGQGRVLHTTLGHADYSQASVGFITLLQRGAEWVATGKVTQAVPADFPKEDKTSSRQPKTAALIKKIELGKTVNPTELDNIVFAGAIDPADTEVFRKKGIKTIVSLRKKGEAKWDEAAWAEKEGFRIVSLPCSGPSELSKEQLAELYKTLDGAGDNEKVLFHCGAGGRVGACWAIYRATQKGVALEDAINEAISIGLKGEKMTKEVTDLISASKK
ncbi:MAG: ThuA domain-containing protein [Pirellulaceae bacterium]